MALRQPAPPTAILAENEMVALACCSTLLQLGRRVPAEVAMMAFGDELPAGTAPLPMTVVAWRPDELAERGLNLLLAQILPRSRAAKTTDVVCLRPELVVRESA